MSIVRRGNQWVDNTKVDSRGNYRVVTSFTTNALGSPFRVKSYTTTGSLRPPAPKQTPAPPAAPKPKPIPAKPTVSFYDLDLQGNFAKPGAPIPVQYGRHICFPDLVAKQIKEVTADGEIHYFLFCIGQGSHDIESIKIGNTLIGSVPGVSFEVLQPGQNVTLYPTVMSAGIQSSMVVSGAYQMDFANAPGTTITKLNFDIEFPQGLYKRELDGTLTAKAVEVGIQARTVDDLGVAIGAWVPLESAAHTFTQTAPIKLTREFTVAAARYEIRVIRSPAESVDPRIIDRVILSRVRSSKTTGHPDYGEVTLLAVKAVTQTKPFDLKDTRLSVISTRKIPVWNGASWGTATASRSIMWAIADAVKANYSAELTDQFLDLSAMKTIDDTLAARGDYFDGRFENKQGLLDVINSIAAAGRAEAYLHDGLLKVFRNEQTSTMAALFNPLNIIEGSFQIEYRPHGFGAPDSIMVEFIDPNTWKTNQVLCDFGSTSNPERVSLFGIADRNHAYREGMTLLASDLYSRTFLSFETGLEGLNLTKGQVVLISHDVHNFGQWGAVFNTIGADKIVLSNPINFNAQSAGFLFLSTATGGVTAALSVTEGSSPYELVLTAGIPAGITAVGGDSEASRYAFVTSVSAATRGRIVSIEPSSDDTIAITCVAEDDRVHTADVGAAPAEATAGWDIPDEANVTAPTGGGGAGGNNVGFYFGNLSSTLEPGWIEKLIVTWSGGGYDQYKVEFSYNGGASWTGNNMVIGTRTEIMGGNLIGAPRAVRVTPYNKGIGDTAKTLTLTTPGTTLAQVNNVGSLSVAK